MSSPAALGIRPNKVLAKSPTATADVRVAVAARDVASAWLTSKAHRLDSYLAEIDAGLAQLEAGLPF